jgi:hypothetical protein
MQQYLIVGLNAFGAAVVERTRALPIERNVVYHVLECGPASPVAGAYLAYRKRLLDVLNREVYNFANTPLTVYLVGLMVEEHVADDLMHLGYLFKTFFRENIILNPRVKVVTALPTILPEEAHAWLPETGRALARIDGYAALRTQFEPSYPDLKRTLPAISGPPFEDIVFCYSESLDADDVSVSAQAAATKIYFDLVVLPERMAAEPRVAAFYRSFPAGQGFAPVTGTAVAFLPSLAQLVRDEMEYALMLRLCERFFPVEPPDSEVIDRLLEDVLREAGALKLRQVVDGIVEHALEKERWFDLAGVDSPARYDIEMSPPPDAYLARFLSSLEHERNRFASRVRDLALDLIVQLPGRLAAAIRARHPNLDLRQIDTLFTRGFFRVCQLVEQGAPLAAQLRSEWDRARRSVEETAARLKEIAGAKDARMKHGSETEGRMKELLRGVDNKELLRHGLAATVADALSGDEGLESRLREAYESLHELYASFLKRRNELMAHFTGRRDEYLRRRELYLYVFNQVFRKRILDVRIEQALAERGAGPSEEALLGIVPSFFFKKWSREPGMPLEDVEKALMEQVRIAARKEIEEIAGTIDVDYKEVVGILHEIAEGQANSIFDMKYKEHPQAAYRRAMFLYHRDDDVAASLPNRPVDGVDLCDVAVRKDLPFQVLQVQEIYNLPFRALRQHRSLEPREPPRPAEKG